MSAQTQRRTNTRRRAMSADHALTRAQERVNSKIDAAVNAGITGQLQKKSMNVTLKLASGSSVRLVSSDGVPTREGNYYYSKLAIDPPAIFPYEQGLHNNKYIVPAITSWGGPQNAHILKV